MERTLKIVPGPVAPPRPASQHKLTAVPQPGQARPRLLRSLLALGAVAGIAFAGALWAWPIGEPERLGAPQGDAWRGAYLARAAGCVACHTAPGGQALAGGAPLETPFGTFVPPNITPDSEGGIGGWTLDEFAVAVRQGVAPEGHAYYPAFPYEFYAEFTDAEVADLFAAIQTVPPVSEPAPDHHVGFPFNLRMGLKLWRAAFLSEPYVTPVMGRSELWNRGQALVEGASHCAACHTGRNLLGGLDPDERMAGSDALPGGATAPSIRLDDLRARGWTPASLAYALRTGVAPDGDALGGAMAEAIHQGTAYLEEADREAIALYLLDADDLGDAVPTAAAPAPMEGMGDMAGMDHSTMVMDAPEASVDEVDAVQPTSATDGMAGMAGMDQSAMVMDAPEVDASAARADQGATPAWSGLRPRPRPESR